jgi:hypothetical protein
MDTLQILPSGASATVTAYELPWVCRAEKVKGPLATIVMSEPLFDSFAVCPAASPLTVPPTA